MISLPQRVAIAIVILCSALGAADRAAAGSLVPLSYDEPNGYSSTYHYWDGNYTGSGDKTTDGAPLTGGLGALTDGFITNLPWYEVSNDTGTGPYVGWNIDPTITFHFSGANLYQSINVFVDNSDAGGVSAPASISISDGTHSQLFPVIAPAPGNPIEVTLDVSAIGLTGDTVSVTLNRADVWVFAQEIQFEGTSVVPEPASLSLLGLGILGALGISWRSSRKGGFPAFRQ
jgi:hypothetical protein